MKENVLDVLMYLFENYYLDDETEFDPDRESLHGELLEAGFPHGEINKAFDWLEGLSAQRDDIEAAPEAGHSIRLFTEGECARLDVESRGFLMFLEQIGILTPNSRELVIDRIMALGTAEIDIDHVKWVTLMVLFNQPGQEAAYAWMEDLVFENLTGSLH
ncbi:MAG TPA: DUF494 family protein [Gammaproteobacteria bacterium]|nr:DUF494 family protein [Gammaproteobacteria bacterium]